MLNLVVLDVLTLTQRVEIILIPVVTTVSAILISIFGLLMIGELTLQLITMPLIIGTISGLLLSFIIDKRYPVTSFELANQNMRRGLLIIVLIGFVILLLRLLSILEDIFLTLAMMGGSLGMGIGVIDFFCLILLYRTYLQKTNKEPNN
ncbi:MAG: hypothetical protein ACFFBD_28670 [Candidatus Hodarchaeota archaeon]